MTRGALRAAAFGAAAALLGTPPAGAADPDAVAAFEARLAASGAWVCGAPHGAPRTQTPHTQTPHTQAPHTQAPNTQAPRSGVGATAEGFSPQAIDPNAPWMAQLEIYERDTGDGGAIVAHCGAAVLTANWLLTAAHCVGLDPWISITVTAGAADLDDDRALRREGDLAICHQEFAAGGAGPDIALLRVDAPFPTDLPSLRVASPPEMRQLFVGGRAFAAGWRRRERGVASRLRTAPIRLASPAGEAPGVIVGAPERAGPSLCLGESGAPLVADLGRGPALVGVFSSVDAIYNPASGRHEELCAGFEARSYFTGVDGLQSWISGAIRACDVDRDACLSFP